MEPPGATATASGADVEMANAQRDESASTGAMPPPAPPPPPPALAQAPAATATATATDARPPPADGRDAGQVASQRAPILIYTANYRLAVFDVAAGLETTEQAILGLGGFVVRRTTEEIVVRVPAARFQEAVARIEKVGEIVQRNVEAQDVTEEFLDAEIRLRNARALRDRLAQLMAKANNVQDSLMIERELARVAGEIERLEGRLKFLRDRAAFSTLTVSFHNRRADAPPPSVRLPFPWLRSGGLSRLLSL